MEKAIILFSGGLDSTVSLHLALVAGRFDNTKALIIDYGQKHKMEINSAKRICKINKIDYILFKTDLLSQIGNSSLIGNNNKEIDKEHTTVEQQPSTFVPGRNLLFILVASCLAVKESFNNIIVGACADDISPDAKLETLINAQQTLNLGMGKKIKLLFPLIFHTKEQIINLSQTLPGCWSSLSYSHTCYKGVYPPCNKCSACIKREQAFKNLGLVDPITLRKEL